MIVYLDIATHFAQGNEQIVDQEVRRYYVAPPPKRMLIVCRHDLRLPQLAGCYVDASIGNDIGMVGFALYPDLPQSKMTIYRLIPKHKIKQDVVRLSTLLDQAPQSI